MEENPNQIVETPPNLSRKRLPKNLHGNAIDLRFLVSKHSLDRILVS